ncbi:hypothetical protein V8F06_011657 [Rhypophila decipiens]
MEDLDLNVLLQEGYTGVRKALARVQEEGKPASWMTTYLLKAIEAGEVPAIAFDRYLDACHHDCEAVKAGLAYTHNELVCTTAIRHLVKLIRSSTDSDFATTWSGVGGAEGLARLMRGISVKHVKLLCQGLGKTAFIPGARGERQRAFSKLFQLLWADDQDSQNTEWHDPRPLRPIYLHLIKSCTAEICLQFEPEALQYIPKRGYKQLLHGFQPAAYTDQILAELLGPVEEGTPPANLFKKLNPIRPFLKSARRNFVLEVFRKVIHAGPTRFDAHPRDMLDFFVDPLLSKCNPGRTTLHIWHLIFLSFQKYPHFVHDMYRPQWEGYLNHAISWWKWASSSQAPLERLKQLLELIRPDEHGLTLGGIASLLIRAKVPAPRRGELFCLIMRHYRRFGMIDFESSTMSEEDNAKLRAIKDINMCEIFTFLPPDHGLRLLEVYLLPEKPAGFFVRPFTYPRSILRLAQGPNSERVDLEILHCYLRHQASGKTQDVEDLVKVRMDKAKQSRDWEGRAFWAKSALFLSIASGDVGVYSRALAWAARFHKDNKTVAALYAKDVLGTREGIRLVAGVPMKAQLHLGPLAAVREHIKQGNQIVSQLIGLVRDGLNEPGIAISTWSYVTTGALAADMFKMRARFANYFQDHHCLHDATMGSIVWEPTITMLLEVEAFALQDSHLTHNFCHPAGIVGLDQVEAEKMRPHLWNFFDELARARDRLWADVRAMRCPKVLDLQGIWPCGLPTQFLVRNDCGARFESERLPYLFRRAEGVLSMDTSQTLAPLPDDGEMRRAIGGFVENFEFCLRVYLDREDYDWTTRVERSQMLWDQVTTVLTGDRMTKEEAEIFWRQWVKGWEHLKDDKLKHETWEKDEVAGKPRYLDPVCLDVLLGEQAMSNSTISQLFEAREWPKYTCIDPPAVKKGSSSGGQKLEDQDEKKEALVASAMATLNTMFGTGRQTKTTDSSEVEFADATCILSRYPDVIPAAGLRDIARQALEKKSQPYQATSLVKLVVKSRRPWEACSLVCDIVTAYQDYSGFHRQLLTPGLLNRLPAQRAENFIQMIGEGIASNLEAPKRIDEAEGSGSGQPNVKITTVKMLAETLRTTRAVGVGTCTVILMRIFSVAKHIDIRAAVIQSLLDAFDKAADDELRETIIDALCDTAVEVAASIDERFPMSDEDWSKAEKDQRLPEVPQASWRNNSPRDLRPISSLLMGHLKTLESRHPDWIGRWCREIVAGILVKSIKNNNRWMRLFLKMNGIDMGGGDGKPLTPFPVDPTLLNDHLETNYIQFLTGEVFEILKGAALFQIRPPEHIHRIIEAVRAKEVIVGGNNAKNHWGSSCIKGYKSTEPPRFVAKVATLLQDPPQWLPTSATGDRISVVHLQEFLYCVMNGAVMEYPSSRLLFDKLTTGVLFRFILSGGGEKRTLKAYQMWRENILPVARRVVQTVKSIGSSHEWRDDSPSERRPRSLPDMFPYALYMLQFPSTMFNLDENSADGDEINRLGADVFTLVDDLCRQAVVKGVPYHRRWKILTEFVCKDPGGLDKEWMGRGVVSSGDFLRIAAALWGMNEESACRAPYRKLRTGLVLELVNKLIRGADYPLDRTLEDREEVLRRIMEMVEVWEDSKEVWIQEMALETKGVLEDSVMRAKVGETVEDSWGLFS